MDITFSLLGITGALIAGAVSPGPSFILVARTAAASSRHDGVAAAFGMACGSFAFALIAILGLHTLLAAASWSYVAAKIAGGVYLIFLATRIWRRAGKPVSMTEEAGQKSAKNLKKSFLTALGTQLSNPKTAIILGGIFAALLPREIPLPLYFILPAITGLIDIVWYSIVAYLLSSAAPRAAYLRYQSKIDRVTSGVLAWLGLKLILSAQS